MAVEPYKPIVEQKVVDWFVLGLAILERIPFAKRIEHPSEMCVWIEFPDWNGNIHKLYVHEGGIKFEFFNTMPHLIIGYPSISAHRLAFMHIEDIMKCIAEECAKYELWEGGKSPWPR